MNMQNCKGTVLLICKEFYTYPMHFIRKELICRGYNVEVLFIQVTESILKDHSFTSFCSLNPDAKIHTLDHVANKYWATYKNLKSSLDFEYLKRVENTYCQDLPIGLLMMSEQCFTTPYHYRFYFCDMTEEQKLYWVQLLFQELELILDSVNPIKILDIDNAVIGRTVLHQISKSRDILYTTIESSRYRSYWLPTYSLGRSTGSFFINKYNSLINSKNFGTKHIEAVKLFREQENIILPDYNFNDTGKKKSRPIFTDAKNLIQLTLAMIKSWVKNYKYSGVIVRRPLIASYPHAIVFFILCKIRERYLLSPFCKVFESLILGEKYVYFPLHLIPESTTLIKSPFYPNEIHVIEAVSKSLPVGWKLYVKEHGSMIGERPLSFYSQVKRLSNVRLCRLDSYDDPKEWILNSVGVITLTGSTAFEAVMLGKRALIFGNTYYEVIDGVKKVTSFNDLPDLVKGLDVPTGIDNIESCASYVQVVEEFGEYIPITEILVKTRDAIYKGYELTNELNSHIRRLTNLLLKEY